MALKTDATLLQADLLSLMAEIFRVETEQITADTQLGELPQWDSMAHMDLMVALESRFGVEITAETISQLTSFAAIQAHLEGQPRA